MAKSVCLTPSWVIAKAIKVAAEMSSTVVISKIGLTSLLSDAL